MVQTKKSALKYKGYKNEFMDTNKVHAPLFHIR